MGVTHNLAPIMFGGLILFLLVGFPVAFSLGACGPTCFCLHWHWAGST